MTPSHLKPVIRRADDDLSVVESYLDEPWYLAHCALVLTTIKKLARQKLPATTAELKRADKRIVDRPDILLNALESLVGTGKVEWRQFGDRSCWITPTKAPMVYRPTIAFSIEPPRKARLPDAESMSGRCRL